MVIKGPGHYYSQKRQEGHSGFNFLLGVSETSNRYQEKVSQIFSGVGKGLPSAVSPLIHLPSKAKRNISCVLAVYNMQLMSMLEWREPTCL